MYLSYGTPYGQVQRFAKCLENAQLSATGSDVRIYLPEFGGSFLSSQVGTARNWALYLQSDARPALSNGSSMGALMLNAKRNADIEPLERAVSSEWIDALS